MKTVAFYIFSHISGYTPLPSDLDAMRAIGIEPKVEVINTTDVSPENAKHVYYTKLRCLKGAVCIDIYTAFNNGQVGGNSRVGGHMGIVWCDPNFPDWCKGILKQEAGHALGLRDDRTNCNAMNDYFYLCENRGELPFNQRKR